MARYILRTYAGQGRGFGYDDDENFFFGKGFFFWKGLNSY